MPGYCLQNIQTGQTSQHKVEDNVVVLHSNPSYIKQKCKQAFKRMHSQKDPTTPARNYYKFVDVLKAMSIRVIEVKVDGKPDLEFEAI